MENNINWEEFENKIKILAGNLKTTINKREYLFSPA